jgi:hypothetical protein
VDWIKLAEEALQWRGFLDIVFNLPVIKKENFVTS